MTIKKVPIIYIYLKSLKLVLLNVERENTTMRVCLLVLCEFSLLEVFKLIIIIY